MRKKNILKEISEITGLERDNLAGIFKKYDYQYGNKERYLACLIKFLVA